MSDAPFSSSIGHQGLMIDGESGLIYVRYRYLEPGLAVWITREPYGEYYVDSVSLYECLLSNPPSLLDPMGTSAKSDCVKKALQDLARAEKMENARFGRSVDDSIANYYDTVGDEELADFWKNISLTVGTFGLGIAISGAASAYNAAKVARMTALLAAAREDANAGLVSLNAVSNIGRLTATAVAINNTARSIGSAAAFAANVGINLAAADNVQNVELALEGGLIGLIEDSQLIIALNSLANAGIGAAISILDAESNPAVPNIVFRAHAHILKRLLNEFQGKLSDCKKLC